jgi:Domain of Unknown Function (DUF748)
MTDRRTTSAHRIEVESEREPERPARPPRRRRPLGRGPKIGLGIVATFILLLLAATALSHLWDEPLRRALEAKMNQHLHGYTVQLGAAHAGLLGLRLTLHDLVLRQQANPEPPLLTIPRLRLEVEWGSLFIGHLVGEVLFDRPRLHYDLPQLRREALYRLTPGQRGWQKALASIYPLKLNRFAVHEGTIVYIDDDLSRPLEISHWQLLARNVRNIESPDHVYPSPVHSEGDVFGTGHGVVDGHANFLSEPYPGIHALYRLRNVPLGPLEQVTTRSNIELHRGLLTSHGEVEYAPRWKLVQVAEVRLDGVQLDYVHTAATAELERRRGEELVAAAKRADIAPLVMRLDRLHLTHGSVGFVDRKQTPNYRIFVDDADFEIDNLSNRAARQRGQPASARLRGRFMGSGTARAAAVFEPRAASADFGAEITVENASLPALNDLLRAYEHLEVAAGTFSLYSQVTVRDHYLKGYVKPLFREVQIADSRHDRGESFGAKLREKVLNALAHLLENHHTDLVATRTEISGPLGATHTRFSEILANLLKNAFYQAIRPGLERVPHRETKN